MAQDPTTPSHPTTVSGFTTSCLETIETNLIYFCLHQPRPPHAPKHQTQVILRIPIQLCTFLFWSHLPASPCHKPFYWDLGSSRGVVGASSIIHHLLSEHSLLLHVSLFSPLQVGSFPPSSYPWARTGDRCPWLLIFPHLSLRTSRLACPVDSHLPLLAVVTYSANHGSWWFQSPWRWSFQILMSQFFDILSSVKLSCTPLQLSTLLLISWSL